MNKLRKALSVTLLVAIMPITGCVTASSTTPPAALAPGYLNSVDQTLGQSLAAFHAFALKATADYTSLTPAQQALEKAPLNAFVLAVNTADTLYLAYHQGTATQQQVQTAVTNASTAQAAYTAVGVK